LTTGHLPDAKTPVVYEDFMPDQEPGDRRQKRAGTSDSDSDRSQGSNHSRKSHLSTSEEIAAAVRLALRALHKQKADQAAPVRPASQAPAAAAAATAAAEEIVVEPDLPAAVAPPPSLPPPPPKKKTPLAKGKLSRQEQQQKKNLARRLANLGKQLEAAVKEHRDLNADLASQFAN
jgi:hypothetical protein